MSTKKPRSAQFKLKVAIAALKGEPIKDICLKYEVAESLVHKWKKQLSENSESIFTPNTDKNDKALKAATKKQEKLYETIGQLTVERDFLKKSLSELP
jgi:transposase-like protein